MNLEFRAPQMNDLDKLMEIENAGFTPEEAATSDSMAERIGKISDTFVVAEAAGRIVGYIVGPASDERYIDDGLFDQVTANQPADRYIAVLSLAVHPQFRSDGVGSQLLSQLASVGRQQGREAITLTCLEELIPFYETNGYVNEGVSASEHAGETWFNMVKELK